MALLGKQIDGVWHTSIVVDGVENFYGGGVQQAMAGTTPYGEPVDIIYLGDTHIPREVLLEYIEELKKVFTPEAYNLFRHNCNNFSNELATFLTGSGIPEHITSLPAEVLSTPMGQMLAPMLTGVEAQLGSVQQGDSPLQLQSPVPGVTLPQYQPNPSLPATQPASAEANTGQHVSEPSAGTATSTAAAASTAAPAALALNLQPGGLTPEEPRKQDEAVQEQSSAPEGMPATESRPQLQNVSSQEALDRQAAAKAEFEKLVRLEFAKAMAGGALSANEAAIQAVALARARAEHLDTGSIGV
ncbi:g2495 [Coccomyxa viridis]|uniref:G2495 protein n=1 Tax=Coccomyxa viridis TaxID=1274662 RepID=A0ABP1FKJ0_9CHLO